MKNKTILLFIPFLTLLAGCQAVTPQPIVAATNIEFSLLAGQSATLTDAEMVITFTSISGDERCPSEIECAASGPVTVNLSIRDKNGLIAEEVLQSFTDYKGLAPTMEFEGIKSSVSVDGYQIKITGVLPYPQNRSSSIKASEYVVTLKVIKN